MSHLSPEEQAAATILKNVLSADRIDPRDLPGAPPRAHDFDLMVGSRLIAVEVTQVTDPTLMELYAQLHRLREGTGSPRITTVKTADRWSVWVKRDARMKPLLRRVDSLVAAVEADGVWTASGSGAADASGHRIIPTPSPVRRLLVSGVEAAQRWHRARTKRAIDVLGPTMWAWENVNAPASAIEQEITRNIDKLRNARADERHLFAWAHLTDFATLEGIVPARITEARAPGLPADIDVVWIGAMHGPHQGKVWRCDRGGSWLHANQ
jgi:hypothetical protein